MRPRYVVSSCVRARRRGPLAVLMGLVIIGACNDASPTGAPAASVPHAASFELTERLTIREQGATATLAELEGCFLTETSILAVERATKPEAGSSAEVEVFLDIVESDVCIGQVLNLTSTLSSDVTFTATLSGATLTGTVDVRDVLGNTRLVAIQLTWTGTGDITKGKTTMTIENGGGTQIVLRSKGSSRGATLSGLVDGVDVASVESVATLFDATEGTITITH
jgi:hypothetical protein